MFCNSFHGDSGGDVRIYFIIETCDFGQDMLVGKDKSRHVM